MEKGCPRSRNMLSEHEQEPTIVVPMAMTPNTGMIPLRV